MAVQINSWNPPNCYPELKGEYIDKYYDLVLIKAPENQSFSMHELYDFPLQSEERSWYNIVSHDVMVALISDDLIKFETGSNIYLRLTTKGKNKRKGINENHTVVNVGKIVGGDNYENISAKNLNINSKNPTTNNATENTTPKSQKNSIMLMFWKLISQNQLVSSVILAILLWAIKVIFDIDLKN